MIAAMFLAAFFCASLAAQENKSDAVVRPQTAEIAAKIPVGASRNLQFGPYKWRGPEALGGTALIMTEGFFGKNIAYNNSRTDLTWETHDISRFLHGPFLKKTAADEQKLVFETRIQNPIYMQIGTDGRPDTADKVFLLNSEEIRRALYYARLVNFLGFREFQGDLGKIPAFLRYGGNIRVVGGIVEYIPPYRYQR